MSTTQLRITLCLLFVAFSAARSSAVVLFSDNFNTDSSSLWTQNKAGDPAKQQAQFAFDYYSAFGIPPAPGSSDTLGLRLRANLPIVDGVEVTTRPAGVTSGLSLSPTGKDFGSNYILSMDVWSNFFGHTGGAGLAENGPSEGGTNNIMFAVGTSGAAPLVVGNTGLAAGGAMDGIGLATTSDGGITSDYRIYPASGTIVAAENPAYLAGGTANTLPLYATTFPPVSAPTIQQTIANQEYSGYPPPGPNNPLSGQTQQGAFGFAWHHVVIRVENGNLTWTVNGTKLVEADISEIGLGGNNIAIGVSDVNDSTARLPSLVFTIFDNLVVTDITAGTSGDFNEDGKVDAGDYVIWRKNDGANAALPNDDGAADQAARYTLWRTNFGNPSGAGSGLDGTAAPEPSSLALLAVSAACCWFTRRRS